MKLPDLELEELLESSDTVLMERPDTDAADDTKEPDESSDE